MVADVTAKHRVAFPGAAFLAKRDVRHSDVPSAAGLSVRSIRTGMVAMVCQSAVRADKVVSIQSGTPRDLPDGP